MGIVDPHLSRMLSEDPGDVPGLLAVFDGLDVGVVLLDAGLRYRYANHTARRGIGSLVDDPIGCHAGEVVERGYGPEVRARMEGIFRDVLATGCPHRERSWSQSTRLRDAKEVWYDWTVYRLRDERGAVGLILTMIDVSEHQRLTQKLAQQNRELSAFAGHAAHDLLAPLRQVSLEAELLMEDLGDRLGASERETFGRMTDGLERMRAMVGALLDYSRSTSSESSMQLLALHGPVQAALDNLAHVIDGREADVVVPSDLPRVYGEATLLTQVFQNLVGNALKFCTRRPRVVIVALVHDDAYEIRVRDNGIGVAPRELPLLFQNFTRLRPAEYPGTGLGLASCRKIVEWHGGRIWAEAPAAGGCVIAFTLPIVTQ